MPLTMSEERYQPIKAGVQARRTKVKSAKIEVELVDWDKPPHFTPADDFLPFLEENGTPIIGANIECVRVFAGMVPKF
jgi:hypothetical protein